MHLNDSDWISKNNYNYYLSSTKIQIKYAFGELVMRQGIFWCRLVFNVEFCGDIILVSMLLHNYITDNYATNANRKYFSNFSVTEELNYQ